MKKLSGVLILLLLMSATLSAQTGVIRGTVLDDRQNGVIGAEVLLKSDGQVVARAKTGASGAFSISQTSGRYSIEVTASGFEKSLRTINLTPNLAPMSFPMTISQAAQDALQFMADDNREMEEMLRELMAPHANEGAHDDMVMDLLLAGSAPTTQAAAIRGTVLDHEQIAVVGAGVVVKSGDQVVAETQTGIDGAFNVPLTSGPYTVEVTVAGYDKAVQAVNVTPDLPPLSFPMKAPH